MPPDQYQPEPTVIQPTEQAAVFEQVQVSEFVHSNEQPIKSNRYTEFLALGLVVVLLFSFFFNLSGLSKTILVVCAITAGILIFMDMLRATNNFSSSPKIIQPVAPVIDKPQRSTTYKVFNTLGMIVIACIAIVVALPLLGIMLIVVLVIANGGQSV
jgi:hypothetical protein